MLTLVIGDRNFSSWSLRPWLAARQAGLPFAEVAIRLDIEGGTKEEILKYSPSGKVPCLIDDEGGKRLLIWDSLAICEYLAELVPALWPAAQAQRAEARSVSAEMHSGFLPLRQEMPMDVRAMKLGQARTPEVGADIARIVAIWESCRSRFAASGPFLFGAFSIADAMYAPVVWRFLTYGVGLPPASQAWLEAMLALPAMREWQAGALAEAVLGTGYGQHADLHGRRRGARRVARPAGAGSRPCRGRCLARRNAGAWLQAGWQGFPGVPAPDVA